MQQHSPRNGQKPAPGNKYSPTQASAQPQTEDWRSQKTPFDSRPEILLAWEAKEYEKFVRPRKWYITIYSLFLGLIAYALFSDNLLMAVVFILFAVVLYLFENKDPRMIKFAITTEGVTAHDNLYEYSSLENFWIFYQPDEPKILSLKSKRKYLPYIRIPLASTNPVEIRKILLNYIPEEKHQESFTDAIEKLL